MSDADELRARFIAASLEPTDLADDPITQLQAWLDVAAEAGVHEPTAVTLATVDERGAPDARVVLLRGVDPDGLRWYTDRSSAKGRQLDASGRAALVLAWPVLGRQVRVTGPVTRTTAAEDDAYWATRPRGSHLAANASLQSSVLADRRELDARLAEVTAAFGDDPVPRPERWGGYRLEPERAEFWQQREFRVHDRLRYERDGDGWRIVRLSP